MLLFDLFELLLFVLLLLLLLLLVLLLLLLLLLLVLLLLLLLLLCSTCLYVINLGVVITAAADPVFDKNTSHPSNIKRTLGRGLESGVKN